MAKPKMARPKLTTATLARGLIDRLRLLYKAQKPHVSAAIVEYQKVKDVGGRILVWDRYKIGQRYIDLVRAIYVASVWLASNQNKLQLHLMYEAEYWIEELKFLKESLANRVGLKPVLPGSSALGDYPLGSGGPLVASLGMGGAYLPRGVSAGLGVLAGVGGIGGPSGDGGFGSDSDYGHLFGSFGSWSGGGQSGGSGGDSWGQQGGSGDSGGDGGASNEQQDSGAAEMDAVSDWSDYPADDNTSGITVIVTDEETGEVIYKGPPSGGTTASSTGPDNGGGGGTGGPMTPEEQKEWGRALFGAYVDERHAQAQVLEEEMAHNKAGLDAWIRSLGLRPRTPWAGKAETSEEIKYYLQDETRWTGESPGEAGRLAQQEYMFESGIYDPTPQYARSAKMVADADGQVEIGKLGDGEE